MQHPLQVGQIFRCWKFRSLVYELDRDAKPPKADKSRLKFDHSPTVHVPWTERGQDGWERRHDEIVNLSVEDPDAVVQERFTVVEVALTGGGTGHGPYDVYPDGHHVVARGTSGRTVCFYQSGCFVGVVDPPDVELLDGPPDVPGKWTQAYVAGP